MKKPNGLTKVFKLRLTPALLADIEEFAARDGRTIANWIRKVLEDAVKAWRAKDGQ